MGNMSLIFYGNKAIQSGGATTGIFSSAIFNGNNISVTFDFNRAHVDGGAIFLDTTSITFNGNMLIKFVNNSACVQGGAIYTLNSAITFGENTSVEFHNNYKASRGGAIYGCKNKINFNGNSSFVNNSVTTGGGALYLESDSDVLFNCSISVKFTNNQAKEFAGVIITLIGSNLIFAVNTIFSKNTATNGGAISGYDSWLVFYQVKMYQ